jgi:hypothetical protein
MLLKPPAEGRGETMVSMVSQSDRMVVKVGIQINDSVRDEVWFCVGRD